MKCFVRQDRVSQIQNLSSEKYIIWTMLAWRTLDWRKIYHLNNVHKWSENISSEQCWLEGHLISEWILRDTCEWSLSDTWMNEAWGTLEWMKLEGHLWMKLDLQCSEYMSNNMAWPSTNLQPNCLLASPQIKWSTRILAYFYKWFVLKNSPRGPKGTQPRHLPSFSTPLNWGFSLTSFDAAQLCLSGTTSIDEGESKGDGQVTLNNLVILGRLFSSVQIMYVATNSRCLKQTGNIISPLIPCSPDDT